MKNRMLEIGAYGTVRGEGGNILTYSETCALMPRETSKWQTHEEPSTNAGRRDGRVSTSDEAW